jgi:proline iminopeptidase
MGVLAEIKLESLTSLAGGRWVEWERSGSGEDLVWFEGGPGFWAHLARPDVALIADRFRCHLINAPGCGRTSPPVDRSGYSVAGDVSFYEAACEALGLRRFTLMGHSWGGTLAVAYAAAHPGRVRRLIVIAGWCGFSLVDPVEADAESRRALDRLRERPWFAEAMADHSKIDEITEEDLATWFGRRFPVYFGEPDSAAARLHIERIRREYRYNMEAARFYDDDAVDLRPILGGVHCPTLVLCGEHDWICGPVWNRPIAEAIEGAELRVFDGVGHLPQYEAPELFRSVLFDWLERTG